MVLIRQDEPALDRKLARGDRLAPLVNALEVLPVAALPVPARGAYRDR